MRTRKCNIIFIFSRIIVFYLTVWHITFFSSFTFMPFILCHHSLKYHSNYLSYGCCRCVICYAVFCKVQSKAKNNCLKKILGMLLRFEKDKTVQNLWLALSVYIQFILLNLNCWLSLMNNIGFYIGANSYFVIHSYTVYLYFQGKAVCKGIINLLACTLSFTYIRCARTL